MFCCLMDWATFRKWQSKRTEHWPKLYFESSKFLQFLGITSSTASSIWFIIPGNTSTSDDLVFFFIKTLCNHIYINAFHLLNLESFVSAIDDKGNHFHSY
ncbi:cAMP responsive element binding protein 3-like [Schistosoma haematobium]|uniref:cAMP responsive element binding protein 3-like n=1 Tax=Schistosoma haematobium TaxID=6185 RepID=A0A922LRD8_SCHHA|nr:cAMP responsive element binding protein 3-like [Schistosoma haematobium]KAH9591983.1 cAMP responsive element binding protein 3-like [Schistosoma haematobium]